ncbi:MAG: CBS domain-containing protein [Deltaproteobacteria bacterium]
MSTTRTPRMAGDVMTVDVVTLDENDTLEHLGDAMRLMRFRHMPVVEDGRLVGLVTQRDVLRVSASSLLPSRAQDRFVSERFRVRDIMTKDVWAVPPATPLVHVVEQMIARKIGCVPVVEQDHRLIGLITEADIVKLALELLAS